MFDPPDFPFKELSDSSVNNLFHTDEPNSLHTPKKQATTIEADRNDLDHSNYLNIKTISDPQLTSTALESDQSTQLFVLEANALLGLEPTLLDENTIIIPLQASEDETKPEDAGRLLALQACPLCAELFVSAAGLWEHSVAAHYTEYIISGEESQVTLSAAARDSVDGATGTDSTTATTETGSAEEVLVEAGLTVADDTSDSVTVAEVLVEAGLTVAGDASDSVTVAEVVVEAGFIVAEDTSDSVTVAEVVVEAGLTAEGAVSDSVTEWLICSACERILSTAGEVQSAAAEQLCCSDGVSSRRLETLFVCDKCSALFAAAESLTAHHAACDQQPLDEEAGTTTWFLCDSCQQPCGSTDELLSHMTICAATAAAASTAPSEQPPPPPTQPSLPPAPAGKMWNCGSCNQLFATARELYRHKRGEDRPEGAAVTAYICAECDKPLGSVCALHTHRKTHATTKPGYACRVCARRFNQSGHLAIHMRMHTGERPYPCDLCPKAFKVKVERDDHRRTHTGERPFECGACGKTFTAAARLREHARIHTDQRPYRCEVCGASFRRPYARTVHALIHTGQKPHACDMCGTAFRRSGDMWKHKRTMHGAGAANTRS